MHNRGGLFVHFGACCRLRKPSGLNELWCGVESWVSLDHTNIWTWYCQRLRHRRARPSGQRRPFSFPVHLLCEVCGLRFPGLLVARSELVKRLVQY